MINADAVRSARLRGWILRLLYEERPDPIELSTLTLMLDQRNFPVTRRGLAVELDYLRQYELVRVFPLGLRDELKVPDQAIFLQRYAVSERDTDMRWPGLQIGRVVPATRISRFGVDFQHGLTDYNGVERRD